MVNKKTGKINLFKIIFAVVIAVITYISINFRSILSFLLFTTFYIISNLIVS